MLRDIARDGGTQDELLWILRYRYEKGRFALRHVEAAADRVSDDIAAMEGVVNALGVDSREDFNDLDESDQDKVLSYFTENLHSFDGDAIRRILREMGEENDIVLEILREMKDEESVSKLASIYVEFLDSTIYEQNRTLVDLYCDDPAEWYEHEPPHYDSLNEISLVD